MSSDRIGERRHVRQEFLPVAAGRSDLISLVVERLLFRLSAGYELKQIRLAQLIQGFIGY